MDEGVRQVESGCGPVTLHWLSPESAEPLGLVMAHGAGNSMENPLLVRLEREVASAGFIAARFNFPYMEKGHRAPDGRTVLIGTYRRVLEALRAKFSGLSWAAGGKSLGGRMASYLPAVGEHLCGLWFLGYPLHPPGKTDRLRDAHLYAADVPMLFLHGTRDPLARPECLLPVLARLEGRARLVDIEGGDHSFSRGGHGRPEEADVALLAASTVEWLHSLRRTRKGAEEKGAPSERFRGGSIGDRQGGDR